MALGETYNLLQTPGSVPTRGYGCAFTQTGQYLAIAHQNSPYIDVYKYSSTKTVKLGPFTALSGTAYGCALTSTGTYLAVAHSSGNRLTAYSRTGDEFTLMTISEALASTGYGCAFSSDGTYLAAAHSTSPYLTVYKRDGTTWTKLTALTGLDATGYACAFSSDDTYLAVAYSASPYVAVYKRSGDTFTQVDALTAAAGTGRGIAFYGDYLAVAHSTSPYVTVYKRSGDIFTALSALTAANGIGRGCSWSQDGTYLAVAHSTSPYITVYKRTDDSFAKVTALTALAGIGYGCSFSEDRLAVAHDDEPGVVLYTWAADTFTLHDTLVSPGGNGATGNSLAWSANETYLAMAHTTWGTHQVSVYKQDGGWFFKLHSIEASNFGNAGTAAAFSSDATYLAIAHYTTPFITIYKRSSDTFTKLSALEALTNVGWSISWSPDDTYVAAANYQSPWVEVYKRSGDTFTKLADPEIPIGPASSTSGICNFDSTGVYLAYVYTTAAAGQTYHIVVWKRTADAFALLANPADDLPGKATDCAWSPDGTYLAVAHYTTPYVTVYKRTDDTLAKVSALEAADGTTGWGVSWTSDSLTLAVTCSGATTAGVTLYSRSGDTFTKVVSSPITTAETNLYKCAFSPNDTYLAMALGSNDWEYLQVYGDDDAVTGPTGDDDDEEDDANGYILVYHTLDDTWCLYSGAMHCFGNTTEEIRPIWTEADNQYLGEDGYVSQMDIDSRHVFGDPHAITLAGHASDGKVYKFNDPAATIWLPDACLVDIETIWMNPFVKQGLMCALGPVKFLVEITTANRLIQYEIYKDHSDTAWKTGQIVLYDTVVPEKKWVTIQGNGEVANFHKLRLYSEDFTQARGVVIHAIMPYFKPAGRLRYEY